MDVDGGVHGVTAGDGAWSGELRRVDDCVEIAGVAIDADAVGLDGAGSHGKVELLVAETFFEVGGGGSEGRFGVGKGELAEDDAGMIDGDGEGPAVGVGIVGGSDGERDVETLLLRDGRESRFNLCGQGAGLGQLAVVERDAGFELMLKVVRRPPGEVDEADGQLGGAGGGGEGDDEGGVVDVPVDVGEGSRVGELLQAGLDFVLRDGDADLPTGESEELGGVLGWCAGEADGFGRIGLRGGG